MLWATYYSFFIPSIISSSLITTLDQCTKVNYHLLQKYPKTYMGEHKVNLTLVMTASCLWNLWFKFFHSKHPVVNGAKFSRLQLYSYKHEKVHSSYRKAEKVSWTGMWERSFNWAPEKSNQDSKSEGGLTLSKCPWLVNPTTVSVIMHIKT